MKQILSVLILFLSISCKSQKTLVFPQVNIPVPEMINEAVLDWNTQQPGYTDLTKSEQTFYYWVNYSRINPEDFYNNVVLPIVKTYPQLKGSNLNSLESDLKQAHPMNLFKLNTALLKMAAYHADDITKTNANPTHNSTNGEAFSARFKEFGLNACGGENISFGGGDTDPLFMLVLLYMDLNVPDLGHRKALLNPNYLNTGISIKKYKNGNTFLVQDFACDQK